MRAILLFLSLFFSRIQEDLRRPPREVVHDAEDAEIEDWKDMRTREKASYSLLIPVFVFSFPLFFHVPLCACEGVKKGNWKSERAHNNSWILRDITFICSYIYACVINNAFITGVVGYAYFSFDKKEALDYPSFNDEQHFFFVIYYILTSSPFSGLRMNVIRI